MKKAKQAIALILYFCMAFKSAQAAEQIESHERSNNSKCYYLRNAAPNFGWFTLALLVLIELGLGSEKGNKEYDAAIIGLCVVGGIFEGLKKKILKEVKK